jgi:serine/threonine protein kinase
LKDLEHPGIIRLIEFFHDPKRYYLVMDYCSGGSLFEHLQANGPVTEAELAPLMHRILYYISFCHRNNIVHRDIKLESFMLINKAGRLHDRVRLIDLSKSAALEDEEESLDDRMGTAYYLAPEVFEGKSNMKTDIWAVGVMAYMLISNRPPFNG